MSRTRPISTTPRVNAGCGAIPLALFGLIFLAAGLSILVSTVKSGVFTPPNLIFPIPFIAFGLIAQWGALHMWRSGRAEGKGRAAISTQATAHEHRFAASGGIAQTVATGPLVLRAGAARLGRLAAILAVTAFWNGIVGLFTWMVYVEETDGSIWPVRLFLVIFQVVGLALFAALGHAILVLFNPRPTLTLTNGRPRLGESLTLQWELQGATGRLRGLRIDLKGKEEAKFRRGTDTVTDTKTFHRGLVAEARDAGRIARGMTSMSIPSGTMHSFTADNNKIIWELQVTGELGWWPDLDETFEITVTP